MLLRCDYIRVFFEATAEKELVELLTDGLYATLALGCMRGVAWVDIWSDVKLLVYVIEDYLLGERMWLILCLGVQVLIIYWC